MFYKEHSDYSNIFKQNDSSVLPLNNSFTKFDVLIVGAGPAGLFAARELSLNSKDFKIALIDAGQSMAIRRCNMIEYGLCKRCQLCNLPYGIGGAGMFSDGKLSLYPAGSGLVKILKSEANVVQLNQYVLDTFLSNIKNDEIAITNEFEKKKATLAMILEKNNLQLKNYTVAHLGTETIQEYCKKLEKELIERWVQIYTETWLYELKKSKNFFIASFKKLNGEQFSLFADRVILSTGKASGNLINKIITKLKVKYDYDVINLGVRVETTRDAIKKISENHLDAKIKMKFDKNIEARTFCLCDGGYLVHCFYDNFINKKKLCTISGFSYARKKSNNSNFSILVNRKNLLYKDPFSYQIEIINRINKASSNGSTIVQRWEDFLADQPTSLKKLQTNSIQSTLKGITPVNIRKLLPNYIVRTILDFINRLGRISPKILNPDTLLHAPVWEVGCYKIKTEDSLSTSIPGLYIIGDANGAARGIVQASSMGIAVAQQIIKELL